MHTQVSYTVGDHEDWRSGAASSMELSLLIKRQVPSANPKQPIALTRFEIHTNNVTVDLNSNDLHTRHTISTAFS